MARCTVKHSDTGQNYCPILVSHRTSSFLSYTPARSVLGSEKRPLGSVLAWACPEKTFLAPSHSIAAPSLAVAAVSPLHLHLLCACLHLKRKASQEAHHNVLMSVKRTLVLVKPGDGDRGRPGRREPGSKARWDWREKRVWSPVPSGRARRSLPGV